VSSMLCRLGNGIGPGVTTGNHRQAADADARATGMCSAHGRKLPALGERGGVPGMRGTWCPTSVTAHPCMESGNEGVMGPCEI